MTLLLRVLDMVKRFLEGSVLDGNKLKRYFVITTKGMVFLASSMCLLSLWRLWMVEKTHT